MRKPVNYLIANLIIILFGTLCITFISCNKKPSKTTIHIEVANILTDTVDYYLSKNGIDAYPLWLWNSIGIDTSMQTTIEFDNSELNSIIVKPRSNDHRESAFLFIKPGDNYSIRFDPNNSIPIEINGEYKEGQQFLTEFRNSSYTIYSTEKEYIMKQFTDTVPESIHDNFVKNKAPHIDKIKSIYNSHGIDKERFRAIQTEINYYYFDNLLKLLRQKSQQKELETLKYLNNTVAYPINLLQNDFQKLLDDLFKEYSNNQEHIKLYSNLNQHLENFLWYKSLNDSLPNFDHTDGIEFAEKYLDPYLFELYFASQFTGFSSKEPFMAIEMRYEAFKDIFPNSQYLSVIEHYLPIIQQMYSIYNPPKFNTELNDLSEEIVLVDDYQEIKSLNQLTERFKGSVIYIDFWASWCGPCIGEFEYALELHEFANKNSIILLYVSTDEEEKNWINALNNYKLGGYHARVVTDEFRSEFEKYKIFQIPRYMIIDKNGVVAESEAKRPSSGNELFEQLKFYVDK